MSLPWPVFEFSWSKNSKHDTGKNPKTSRCSISGASGRCAVFGVFGVRKIENGYRQSSGGPGRGGGGLGSLTVPFLEVLARENSKMGTVKAAGEGGGVWVLNRCHFWRFCPARTVKVREGEKGLGSFPPTQPFSDRVLVGLVAKASDSQSQILVSNHPPPQPPKVPEPQNPRPHNLNPKPLPQLPNNAPNPPVLNLKTNKQENLLNVLTGPPLPQHKGLGLRLLGSKA